MTRSPITLHILNTSKGGPGLYSKVFDQDVIKLGKLAGSTLPLDDDAVARMHAVIERSDDDNQRKLIDLGSTTGTKLNDKPIKNAVLSHGDRITIGPIHILIQMGDEPVDLESLSALAPKPEPTKTALPVLPASSRLPERGDPDPCTGLVEVGMPNPYEPKPGDAWLVAPSVWLVLNNVGTDWIEGYRGGHSFTVSTQDFVFWLASQNPEKGSRFRREWVPERRVLIELVARSEATTAQNLLDLLVECGAVVENTPTIPLQTSQGRSAFAFVATLTEMVEARVRVIPNFRGLYPITMLDDLLKS